MHWLKVKTLMLDLIYLLIFALLMLMEDNNKGAADEEKKEAKKSEKSKIFTWDLRRGKNNRTEGVCWDI